MKIRTHRISATGGLDVDFVMPPTALWQNVGQKAASQDELPQIFQKPVTCQIYLELSNQDIFLTGDADTSLRPLCARCGEHFDLPFHVDVFLTCIPEVRRLRGTDSYQESEEGLVFFRHEELDLGEIMREQILLALPMRYLCGENCKGLCPRCGTNLNFGEHACKKVAS